MFEEFTEESPLLDALGRWLRPCVTGDWVAPRQPLQRREVHRHTLFTEMVTECAAAGQLPIEWLAQFTGPISSRITQLAAHLTDSEGDAGLEVGPEAASWYRSWLQAHGTDEIQVGDSVCVLGSSRGWRKLNRMRPSFKAKRSASSSRSRNWVIEGLEPVSPRPVPALPLLCAAGLEVAGNLDHLDCIALSRAALLRKVASHGLRGGGLTWQDVKWALARLRELPGADWRERARTDPSLLYRPDVVRRLGRSWRETLPTDTQGVAWEGGGVLLPHYRWRGASPTDWWDQRCRRYAS